MALITSLLILVVVTLIAVSMYRSFGLQEKIAGNTLEKQRSLQAAESALRYGEWWIQQANTGLAVACSGNAVNGNVLTNMRVCTNMLSKPETLPWAGAMDYQPPTMSISLNGGLNNTDPSKANDINYVKTPSLYIAYLGLGPDGKSVLYQVTGAGYGGSSTDSASVVQSVYAMTFRVVDLSGP
ncbi:PilX N-terminal domain-containing pilus assembly protein [Variovorax sp. PAMC26660]|uniref:pilus assembly PilX family protein n=1 Tax=Variovorax sp. PAMC26660 TaxID=2762322 RepID=UPI0021C34A5E|nr:PilX N-terminal domain-containing pilus assembly protein [Variovorax sp. PAMC26660]